MSKFEFELTLSDDAFENNVEAGDLIPLLRNDTVRKWVMNAPYTEIDDESAYNRFPEYHTAKDEAETLSLHVLYEGEEILHLDIYQIDKKIWEINKRNALIDLYFGIDEYYTSFSDSFGFEATMSNIGDYDPDPSLKICEKLVLYINDYLDEISKNNDDLRDAASKWW